VLKGQGRAPASSYRSGRPLVSHWIERCKGIPSIRKWKGGIVRDSWELVLPMVEVQDLWELVDSVVSSGIIVELPGITGYKNARLAAGGLGHNSLGADYRVRRMELVSLCDREQGTFLDACSTAAYSDY